MGRSTVAPRDEATDRLPVAFEQGLDAAVLVVADLARDALGDRFTSAALPEPHPLHPAADHDPCADMPGRDSSEPGGTGTTGVAGRWSGWPGAFGRSRR